MLTVDLEASLSALLTAVVRERDGRALPVTNLISLAQNLPRNSSLAIDFRSVEQLGQPLMVLSIASMPRSRRFDGLTVREREVAACVATGLANREIAARLWLTTATVKDHVHRILAKTGLPNRTAIAAAWERD